MTSELLYTLLEKARNILIKAFRGNILDIFNKEDFFILNRRTLKYWENIINWVVILDKVFDHMNLSLISSQNILIKLHYNHISLVRRTTTTKKESNQSKESVSLYLVVRETDTQKSFST